jgi:hypothetical protein
MDQVIVFGKEEIAHRLQIPMERIEILISECGMPINDEYEFVEWGLQHFDRLWDEMRNFGPIAREVISHDGVSRPSDDNWRKPHGI